MGFVEDDLAREGQGKDFRLIVGEASNDGEVKVLDVVGTELRPEAVHDMAARQVVELDTVEGERLFQIVFPNQPYDDWVKADLEKGREGI